MKNVTFGDVREIENEYDELRQGASPEFDSEIRADMSKLKNLVRLRYAGLALFIGLIAFIALAN